LPPEVVSGRAEHHADLHADLVDEDHHAVGAADRGGELAHRLAHQPGLGADLRLAHVALELGLRRQRRDRVDDDDRDGAGADQRLGDLERLLAGVGLGDQELVDVDAELAGIDRVERVLGIDEGADTARLLLLGDDVQRERGLARALGPIDLDDPALGQAAHPEGDVETDRAGGDRGDVERRRRAELHDRALAEGTLDLRQSRLQRLLLVHAASFGEVHEGRCHLSGPLFHSCDCAAIEPSARSVPALFFARQCDQNRNNATGISRTPSSAAGRSPKGKRPRPRPDWMRLTRTGDAP
jgi:hypothetical protein